MKLKNAAMFSYIPVTDMGRARRFYEETLGLMPKENLEGGVVYECDQGTGFFMYTSGAADASKPRYAFWTVEDFEAEVAGLRAKGVAFEEYDTPGFETMNGILTGGGPKTAWFKDTEGNILAVSQRAQADGVRG